MLSVALCTHNGGKYLAEQLDSLHQQTLLPDEVILSDDFSSDNTLEIANDFARKASFSVRIFPHNRTQGVLLNFSEAISKCQGDYIALCDQDDVWMPEKLDISMLQMKEGERVWGVDSPILVHTDLQVTDQHLSCIHPSMFRAQHLRNETNMEQAVRVLLVQNYVTGCTVLINRALFRAACCPIPSSAAIHDWWLALCAAAMGHILFVDRPTIYYRQHENNQIGARDYVSFANIKKLFSFRDIRFSMEKAFRQDYVFLRQFGTRHTAGRLVEHFFDALQEKNFLLAHSLGVHMQDPLRNAIYYMFLFVWQEHFSRFLTNRKEWMDSI